MRSRSDLHAYQHKAIEFIKTRKRCALFLDMGLGKTVSTLTAYADLTDSFSVSKVLIIAPLRVANTVWGQEVSCWAHLANLKTSLCTGGEKERIAGLLKTADVYIINRENVEWLVTYLGKRWDFDAVVIDESDSFKSASSKRFKALKRILPETQYMTLLSGTPSPNGLLDLWAQMYLVDFGERLGRTMTSYKQRFFESDYMGYKFSPRDGADKQIQSLISDKVLSMSASDYLQLPDKIFLYERVTLPLQALREYQDFERTLFAEFEGVEIEASCAAVLANKLLQWANGAIYMDEAHNWRSLHDAKLDALEEIISANPNENILVAYNYKHDLERLIARFPYAAQLGKDEAVVNQWNAGKIRLLLAHPASAGHGLNLQLGGCIAVWFGLNWGLGYYEQFNARLYRQGQARPVRIIHIVANETIDERVVGVLSEKGKTQRDLLDALRRK